MLRFPQKIGAAGPLILDHRRKYKLKSFYADGIADADNRVRASFGFTPETQRLNSSKNPHGTGMNLQNPDRECRDIFIPDDGHVFLEFDASEGERRIVDVLTGDASLIERARAMPWERDGHRENAARIFGIPLEAVTDLQRYLGKKGKHLANYGGTGMKLFEELLKDGFVYTIAECQRFIDLSIEEPVLNWQRKTRQEVIRTHRLVDTVWGGEIDFSMDRVDHELFRRAYAWRPQRYLAMLINQRGFKPLSRFLKGRAGRIVLHRHDSLKLSLPIDEIYEVMQFVQATLETSVNYNGIELTIPLEWSVGLRDGKAKKNEPAWSKEWKWLPTEDEVLEAVEGLRRRWAA